jgi:hypothetical protein
MSKGNKLVKKIKRRERSVLEAGKLWDREPKIDKRRQVLQDSPRAQRLMRKPQRRMDRSFGFDAVPGDPILEYRFSAPSLARFDYDPGAGTDYGIRMTLPNPLTAAVVGAAEQTDITTVADVAGSLNDTYFLLDTPDSADYYVWFNVDAGGTDPAVAGRTGVEVAISAGDLDTVVATALQTALDALPNMEATVLGAVVSVTNDAEGPAPDATDGAAPTGFNFSVTQQGVTDVPAQGPFNSFAGLQPGDTVQILEGVLEGRMLEVIEITDATHIRLDDVSTFTSATDVEVRAMLSEVKKSYK